MVNFESLFDGIYKGKKVLITGHTGFKGSWLALWLQQMGAEVYGYALRNDEMNHLELLVLPLKQELNDIRDLEALTKFFDTVQPDIVFHLAAQALVRASYDDPIGTFSTNVMGTLNVFEACRKTPSVKAIVNVTSDKCYENREWIWGYRENEAMGGYDPYSASKGCAELLTASYRNSYFNPADFGKKHRVLIGSGRAGNVIGGGDWASDRLIPDIVRATAESKSVKIRNPKATRPWQHVLEPLSGYLTLGWKLLEENVSCAEGWNFGPDQSSNLAVDEIIDLSSKYWNNIQIEYSKNPDDHHEANLLMLDCSKANKLLKWKAFWDIEKTIDKTISWYKDFYSSQQVNSKNDLIAYVSDASKNKLIWTQNA
ncbi:MAG: CDP-glucose 4,6-dehydratase [Saprospiraceae bacterium]